jgi:hypothetical protein
MKAVEILAATQMSNMVCRLGGFHTMMGFLGSVSTLMEGSGLPEALEEYFGPNAIQHVMTGKSIFKGPSWPHSGGCCTWRYLSFTIDV